MRAHVADSCCGTRGGGGGGGEASGGGHTSLHDFGGGVRNPFLEFSSKNELVWELKGVSARSEVGTSNKPFVL